MSVNIIMSQVKRLESDVASLNKKLSTERAKEATAIDKAAKAQKN